MKTGDLIAERYRLIRTIGEGGMGSVWAAHHELIGRDVAIKVTGERLARRSEVRDRFQNEARAVGKLRHPNIIDVMDVGQLPDGSLYIVFELLQGASLAEHIDASGRFAVCDAVMIGIEICRALEAAHAAGVVHRDLKPGNVFLHRAPAGSGVTVKVLDFGISKSVDEEGVSLSMTQTGVVLGTPQYMSYEQARGIEDVDLRTDIWGVGAILYELIAGRSPFEAPNYNAMIYQILHDDPPPMLQWGLDVAPEVEGVLARCLAKQRGDRYASARELRNALTATLATLPTGPIRLQIESASALLTARPLPPRPFAEGRASRPARDVLASETVAAPPSDPPPAHRSQPLAPLSSTVAEHEPPARRKPRAAARRFLRAIAIGLVLASAWLWRHGDHAAPNIDLVQLQDASRRGARPAEITAPAAAAARPEAAPPQLSAQPDLAPAAAQPPTEAYAPPPASATAVEITPTPAQRVRLRPRNKVTPKLTNVESAGF